MVFYIKAVETKSYQKSKQKIETELQGDYRYQVGDY